jgi:integrase
MTTAPNPPDHPEAATSTRAHPSRAVVLYQGDGLDNADVWTRMLPDERRRRAMSAAVTRNTDELLSLAESWLLQNGRRGGQTRPLTVMAYRQGIRALLAAWSATPLLTATHDDATRWLRRLTGRPAKESGVAPPAKPSTVVRYRAAGRVLYNALRWAEATTANPFADAHVASDPTPADERRAPYTTEAVERLLAHASVEDRALVLLGAHAGLRVQEALDLTWSAVNLDSAQVTVAAGKGGKKRTVAMSASLVDALRDLRQTGPRAIGEHARYVLPYRAAISARRRLQVLCARAGVTYMGMHSLRHSAGTRLYSETGDLDTTARHLGHTSIETTRIYAHWSDKTLKKTLATW